MDAEEFALWSGNLRVVLIVLCLVLGTVLLLAQGIFTWLETKTAKDAARALVLRSEIELEKLKNPPESSLATKATEVAAEKAEAKVDDFMSKLAEGLAAKAPMATTGLILYVLAAILLGALSFTASTGVAGA